MGFRHSTGSCPASSAKRRILAALLAIASSAFLGSGEAYALEFIKGDFWEYQWIQLKEISGQPDRFGNGRLRFRLGSPSLIDDVLMYELQTSGRSHYISGITTLRETTFMPVWERIGVDASGRVWVTEAASTTRRLVFNPLSGSHTGQKSLFNFFSSTAETLVGSTSVNNGIYIGPAIYQTQSESDSPNCTRLPNGGWVCVGEDYSNITRRDYWRSDIGPVAARYESNTLFGGTFPQVFHTTRDLGLLASSLDGDAVSYQLEAEPTSFANPMPLPEGNTLVGSAHSGDDAHSIFISGVADDIPVHDWYSFHLNFSRTVNASIDWAATPGPADLDLVLTNSTLTQAATWSLDDNVGSGVYRESVSIFLGAGDWLIGVSGFNTAGTAIEYTLQHNLPTIGVLVTADPPRIPQGGSSQIHWDATGTDSCSRWSQAVGGLPGLAMNVPPSGFITSSPNSDVIYTVRCSHIHGQTVTDSVRLFVPEPAGPILRLFAVAALVLIGWRRRARGFSN